MLLKSLDEFYFSQSALIAFENCQLKFRRRYLDGLFWPADWGSNETERKAIKEGRQFHLLAERYYHRGEMPVEEAISPELLQAFQALTAFRPYQKVGTFLPEHELRWNEDGCKLVAKFDLLYVLPGGRAIIYDWKTNATPPKPNYWQNHLQTIVYRYVLAKAGGVYTPNGVLKPQEITMVYWNPKFPHILEPLNYSERQMAKDGERLRSLIAEVKSLEFNDFLPTGDQRRCNVCEYCSICHGRRAYELELEEEDLDFDLDWETVEGVEI